MSFVRSVAFLSIANAGLSYSETLLGILVNTCQGLTISGSIGSRFSCSMSSYRRAVYWSFVCRNLFWTPLTFWAMRQYIGWTLEPSFTVRHLRTAFWGSGKVHHSCILWDAQCHSTTPILLVVYVAFLLSRKRSQDLCATVVILCTSDFGCLVISL